MAPTEKSILKSFLLQKASLRDVLTLAEFSTYFPASKRSSPLVRNLYRDLQSQRNRICESVLKQIKLECRLGDSVIAKSRAAQERNRKSEPDVTHDDVDKLVRVNDRVSSCLAIWPRGTRLRSQA